MSRIPHYLKNHSGNDIPSDAIFMDTETTPRIDENGREIHKLKLGCAAYIRRYAPGKWTQPSWCDFKTATTFWNYVESKLHGKCKLYIFAHNWGFDLPVVDGFRELQTRGWKITASVVESPPVIIKLRRGKQTISIIDTLNIWRVPLRKIGESIGLPKLGMPGSDASSEEWRRYNHRDTEIIMTAMQRWWQFLSENDLGGFAPTIAGQAFRTYRHRFMHETLLIDNNDVALGMARASYHGGRTECFRIGDADTAIFKLDINSMYPDIMQRQYMPTRLCGVYSNFKIDELSEYCSRYCCIAEVTVSTDEPVYGMLHDNRLIFPTGTFKTTLTTPEIQYAIEHGHIIAIARVAVYHRAIIFDHYVDFFYSLRREYIDAGDECSADSAKRLLTNLYGKFGQNGRRYEIVDTTDDTEIRVWTEYDNETGETYKLRQYGGIIEQFTNEGESRDSHPAIASHVTSHGRVRLWRDIKRIDPINCWYCDTDSIWCNERGLERIITDIDTGRLGAYKIEGIHRHVSIYGPKDYIIEGVQRTKGVKSNAMQDDDGFYHQLQFSSLRTTLREPDAGGPIVTHIKKRLSREYKKGHVTDDGYVLPFNIGLDRITGDYVVSGRPYRFRLDPTQR